jgi:hypothetical protein
MARRRDVDSHRLAAQPDGDGLGDLFVVLDDEHTHRSMMPRSRFQKGLSQGDTATKPPPSYNANRPYRSSCEGHSR